MTGGIHFSSQTNEWGTPDEVFQRYNRKYKFTLDPCATASNHKCDKYYTMEDDGLSKSWEGEVVWMNPPYGRGIKDWIKKAFDERLNGVTTVCLIPSRTDTRYWHDYVFEDSSIEFLKGRIKFIRPDGTEGDAAPFPSAIVIFNGR